MNMESGVKMKSIKTKLLLFAGVTGLGLWCMSLQKRILDTGFDRNNLLITDNPDLLVIWGVTMVYLLVVLVMLRKLGGRGTYEENFPACFFSGTASVVAGVLMAFCGIDALVPGQLPAAVCAIVSGCAMAACGIFRVSGKKPVWWLDLLIFICYGVYLVTGYRVWSVSPVLQRFAFELLATIAVMMFSLHRARCATDTMDRRQVVFFGFAGLLLCFLAIPGTEMPGYFFASGVWCVGGMCELNKLNKTTYRRNAEEKPQ